MAINEASLRNLFPFKKAIIIAVAFVALLGGCSLNPGVKLYDLSKMPLYNIELANDKYTYLGTIEGRYIHLRVSQQYLNESGIKITSKQKHLLIKNIDMYLYWYSVAMIQLFHGDYEQAYKSGSKAEIGVKGLEDVLKEIYLSHGGT